MSEIITAEEYQQRYPESEIDGSGDFYYLTEDGAVNIDLWYTEEYHLKISTEDDYHMVEEAEVLEGEGLPVSDWDDTEQQMVEAKEWLDDNFHIVDGKLVKKPV
jgi:hypothetical protein